MTACVFHTFWRSKLSTRSVSSSGVVPDAGVSIPTLPVPVPSPIAVEAVEPEMLCPELCNGSTRSTHVSARSTPLERSQVQSQAGNPSSHRVWSTEVTPRQPTEVGKNRQRLLFPQGGLSQVYWGKGRGALGKIRRARSAAEV